jgi:hypothetical protein
MYRKRATWKQNVFHRRCKESVCDHNMWLASYALSKGFRLKHSEGLIKDKGAVAGETEESVFITLGLQSPEPQLREIIDGKPVWLKT